MEANVRARINFMEKVMAGKYTRAEAEAELDRMEREFGDLAFLPGTVTRKPKPWTMKHLEELKTAAICGAGSREFFSYMAEVGEEVHRKPRIWNGIKRIWNGIKANWAILAYIAAGAAIAALAWRVALWFLRK